MTCVAAAGAPVLTVRDWYFEKDNQPIYLAGYSPKAGIDGGRRPVGRVQEVGSRINYMRTWLELWNREDFMRPFVLVNGRADLSQYNAPFFDRLRAALDGSVKVGVVQELTLFNPWGARYDWEHHWWNPRNNIQHQPVDHTSLYTLGNPCQGLQERWVDKVLETVDASSARNFVIIEIDNELGRDGRGESISSDTSGRGATILCPQLPITAAITMLWPVRIQSSAATGAATATLAATTKRLLLTMAPSP